MKLLRWKFGRDAGEMPPFEELRDAPRFSLVMRTAKLLCETGEYVCIVRDISATGTKLRLFHAIPPDSHLYLELANGRRYAMERVWQDGDHAGYRFASPIVVSDFVEETSAYPRRPLRFGLQRASLVTAGERDFSAMLLNISQQGACIEVSREIAVGQQVRLEAPGLPLRFGHVCWRRDYAHGLVFQQSLRLDDLARRLFELQPYAAEPPAGRAKRYA